MRTFIINLIGAPGVGKSTLSALLYYKLKALGISIEMTIEFAKELIFNEDKRLIQDQLIVLGEQYRRLFILNEKVAFIITDSPILLSIFYNRLNKSYPNKIFEGIVKYCYSKFNNINILLERNFEYNNQGRIHNQKESNKLQKDIETFLIKNNYNYLKTDGQDISLIFEYIARQLLQDMKNI